MGKTKIEWATDVWNPVTGCTKVSQGCKFCYAERIFHRPYPGRDFTDVQCHPERLTQPLHWKKPLRIFVNSISDLFHKDVPVTFIRSIFKVMGEAKQHTFMVLTKRAERMLEVVSGFMAEGDFSTLSGEDGLFPFRNVWLGVSVEDQPTVDERISLLLQTPAAVRFVSYEPALGPIRLYGKGLPCEQELMAGRLTGSRDGYLGGPFINWVIAGGESGPHARPSHPDWFRSVRRQCRAAGVPFFMKQITENGRKLPMASWPEELKIREFPQ